MSIIKIEQFLDLLPRHSRLIGLDVGKKTIGVALSDTSLLVATPYKTIFRTKFTKDALELKQLVEEERAGGLVIGLPVNMNGTEGQMCQSIRQFGTNLLEFIDIPICYQDERLSTMAVQRTLDETEMAKSRHKQVIDKMAASFILQGALDRLQNLRKSQAQE